MEIILKDETKKISFATDKTDNDNYVTLTMEVNGEEIEIEIDVLVTELLATAQAFMINKREKEESQEHYN